MKPDRRLKETDPANDESTGDQARPHGAQMGTTIGTLTMRVEAVAVAADRTTTKRRAK